MFASVVDTLIFASVGTALLRTYLTINKVWTRKSDENVAQSISVFASILSLATFLPFFIQYAFIDGDYGGAASMALAVILSSFLLLVGSGLWVTGKTKRVSFWTLFMKALKLETNEAGDLVKAFIAPKGADLIIEILYRMALIDQVVDEKEVDFIQTFAKSWHLEFDPEDMNRFGSEDGQAANYMALRERVVDYVELRPPPEQAAQLRDVITSLANVDNEVSEEEAIILEEINGVLNSYALHDADLVQFDVVIAPQSEEQKEAITMLVPDSTITHNEGGEGYLVGSYYSERIARMVCQKYRSLSLFTTVEKRESARA